MPHRRPNEPKDIKAYKSTLVNLMRYKHRINFPANYRFSIEELSAITPEDIYKWFAFKVYGTETPGPTENPIFGTKNACLSWKKTHIIYHS